MKYVDVSEAGVSSWRRRFLQGLGAVAGLAGLSPGALFAAQEDRRVLRGSNFDLEIGPAAVNFTGADRIATVVNGQLPAPTLYWTEGDTVTIRVTNRLPTVSSIHWHGILLPAEMDGVPGLSFAGIEPGQTFTYRFDVKQSGTYWYHSHSAFQEQTGLYGPIVVIPKGGERVAADRDYVVMLSDWTDEKPERVLANLKKMSDFFNNKQPTFGEFVRDVQTMGFSAAVDKRKMWNQMRMMPNDFSDVTASRNISGALRYLINGATAEMNWTGLFRPGEKVRLRLINGAATTIFDLRIPGLKMTVISADGQDVEPVTVDEIRISVAETYDVIVEPSEEKAYTVFAQSIGRSGFVRATLAPRAGMQAPVPAVDEAQWLTMTDMMGAMTMSGMHGGGHGGHGTDAQATGGGSSSPARAAAASSHQGHTQQAAAPADAHAAHAQMSSPAKPVQPPKVTHARTEYGPGVDMHVDMPRTNLDDPGVNLRGNGRRVLTYADLRTVGGTVDPREPTREIELHLTGNMERFMWSFDGQKFSEALPIHFRYGERLRIVLVNDTMMNHPIHLHGMWSDLESENGEFQVRKHTINVQPAQRIAYRVTADARGHWAFHCHLMYHMEAGMFREVVVS
ncbi:MULTISPECIES: copper resistance system multicopper oxidase [Massilia]|uniref:Copper resistance system multicopper oxidase n=2 Tax=Massilia TaxID=149698 RepID=A0A5C7FQZ1_9BURK|nr:MULTISPECIES: copper resistance system multicopper oxidase [Massilia]TXF98364.1 copper resistance system multicopper oxidase [Massilia arenae]